MTEKQKIVAVIGGLFLIAAFAFIYGQFASQRGEDEAVPTPIAAPTESSVKALPPMSPPPTGTVAPTPATPDGVADDILSGDADLSALDEETAGETEAASEGAEDIDSLTNSYEAEQN